MSAIARGEVEACVPSSPPAAPSLDLFLDANLYERLRRLARTLVAETSLRHCLQAEDLLHETVLRMMKAAPILNIRDASHCAALCILTMRRTLVDLIRASRTQKREGEFRTVSVDAELCHCADRVSESVIVRQLLTRLAIRHPRQGAVARLRLFEGAPLDEIADRLCISSRTAKRDWESAKIWLCRQMDWNPLLLRVGSPRAPKRISTPSWAPGTRRTA